MALILGNAVHHALERFFGLPVADRGQATLHRALRSVWRQHAPRTAFASREEEVDLGRSALTMLSSFAETFDVSVIPLAREQWVSRRLPNGVTVFGKVDRIDRAGDNVQVVDYKTGRRPIDGDDLPGDSSAQVYGVATRARTGREVERVRVIQLALGREARWDPEPEDLDDAEGGLVELTDRIRRDRDFAAAPGAHCAWCPYQVVCPEASGVTLDELTVPEDILF